MPSPRNLFLALSAAGILAAQGDVTLAERITSRLRPNDLKADVSFLASDALQGRATPSPGLDMAAEYIAAQFRRAGLEPVVAEGREIDESEHDSRLRQPTRLRNELQLEACRGLSRSMLSLECAHAVWSAGAGAAGSCSGAAEQPEGPGTKRGTPAFTLTGLSRTKPRSFERTPVAHGPCEQTGRRTVVEP